MENKFGFEKREAAEPQNEQTIEQILTVLETALREERPVDLVIENSDGPKLTSDLYIEEIRGDYLMVTYKTKDGRLGEGIPLELKRIKKAVSRFSSEK